MNDPGPQPVKSPPLFLGHKPKRPYYKDRNEVPVHEGYEPFRLRRGWFEPIDRHGQLRRPDDTWWESTWLDGFVVPIIGRATTRGICYKEPKGFARRRLCGAWMPKNGVWCRYPLGQCLHNHCQGWSKATGRTCPQKTVHGYKKCRKHGGKRRRDKKLMNSSTTNIKEQVNTSDVYYSEWMEPARASIFQRLLESENPTDISQEIAFMRESLINLQKTVKDGGSHKLWLELVNTWNKFASAKSEAETSQTFAKLGQLITEGYSASSAEQEMRRCCEAIARVCKTQKDIQDSERKMMSPDQAMVFVMWVLEKSAQIITLEGASSQEKIMMLREELLAKIGSPGPRAIEIQQNT